MCVFSRIVEYSLDLQNINFTAIRTVRVLRPLKAINRVPSKLQHHFRLGLPVTKMYNNTILSDKKCNLTAYT